jgi:uncharacterized membrane protein
MAVVLIIAIVALVVAGSALRQARAAAHTSATYYRGAVGAPGTAGTVPDDRKQPESNRMLDERYAKGEIGREEYIQRQTDLHTTV